MTEIRLEIASLREGAFAVRLHGDTVAVGDNPLPAAARRLLGRHACGSDDIISLWWGETRVAAGKAAALASVYPAEPEPVDHDALQVPAPATRSHMRSWRADDGARRHA